MSGTPPFENNTFNYDGHVVELSLNDGALLWAVKSKGTARLTSVPIKDVIGVTLDKTTTKSQNAVAQPSHVTKTTGLTLHYTYKKGHYWKVKTAKFTGAYSEAVFCSWQMRIMDYAKDAVPTRPSSMLVIINPSAGSSRAVSRYNKMVAPLFKSAQIKTTVYETKDFADAARVVKESDLSAIDSIVVMAGDGTFGQSLTGLIERHVQENGWDLHDPKIQLTQPNVIMGYLPAGTGEGMANMTVGVKDLVTSAIQIIVGNVTDRAMFAVYNGGRFMKFAFLLSAFGFTSHVITISESIRQSYGVFRYPVSYWKAAGSTTLFSADIEIRAPTKECRTYFDSDSEWKPLVLQPPHTICDIVHFPYDMKTFQYFSGLMMIGVLKRKAIFKYFKALFRMYTERTTDDMPADFLELFLCTGFRFTIKDFDSLPENYRNINIDGDPFPLQSNKVEIRCHLKSLRTYGHNPLVQGGAIVYRRDEDVPARDATASVTATGGKLEKY